MRLSSLAMTPELYVLDDALRHCSSTSLWCADENTAGFIPAAYSGAVLTNRFDIYQQLKTVNSQTLFNDFDFQSLPASNIDKVVFRIAKEKALNVHIIVQAFAHLQKGQNLVLIGYKNEGIDSLASFIQENITQEFTLEKHKAQLRCFEFVAQEQALQAVQDNYADLQEVQLPDINFFSKPGVFGWNKLDKGSELLMQAFNKSVTVSDKKILDLGCGYGYLSIMARQAGFTHIDATDNNAAAIIACTKNFARLDIQGEVFADDHAEHCPKKYDIVLCNPPFHQGFDHRKNLTEVFIQQAHSLLKPRGEAYFVVNQFIGIEKIAAPLFEKCELLDKTGGFKVFLLKKK
jgi:16S rRNA (guanine1207-N2)-methyltransferase